MIQHSQVDRNELVAYCNKLLQVHTFKDYCPNGLQVEGKGQIKKIVSGVTASQALLDAAIAAEADMILVHHGYFWRSEPAVITGMRQKRIKTLLQNDTNLLAYHLPLDAHVELGNNAQLAKILNITVDGVVDRGAARNILFYGRLDKNYTINQFCDYLTAKLQREPMHLGLAKQNIQGVAWCTGAAQHYLQEAVELGVDAFISGEVSENTLHTAHELGIQYFAAGHHATERYGVQALGQHLMEKFDIQHQFIDINNPV